MKTSRSTGTQFGHNTNNVKLNRIFMNLSFLGRSYNSGTDTVNYSNFVYIIGKQNNQLYGIFTIRMFAQSLLVGYRMMFLPLFGAICKLYYRKRKKKNWKQNAWNS